MTRNYTNSMQAFLVLYNSWVVGIFLEPKLTLHGGTISELGAKTVDTALLYRVCDFLAGFILIYLVPKLIKPLKKTIQRITVAISLCFLGIATVVDSLLPLDCTPTISKACHELEIQGLLSTGHYVHIYESVVASIVFSAAPIVLYLTLKNSLLKKASLALAVYMLIWTVDSAYRTVFQISGLGYSQKLFMIIFAWWIYVLAREKSLSVR